MSYRINSIFSGSCAQNNNYYITPAAFYFLTNCMSHSPVDWQTIVPTRVLIQGKQECILCGVCGHCCISASTVGVKRGTSSSVCGTPGYWRHMLSFQRWLFLGCFIIIIFPFLHTSKHMRGIVSKCYPLKIFLLKWKFF